MKKYYLTDGEETFGPFSIDELKEKSLSEDSYVWYEDMDNWKPAGEIDELAGLFVLPTEPDPIVSPPPIEPPPIEPPLIVPSPVAAQTEAVNQMVSLPKKHSSSGPPKVWPKILLAIGLPVAIFVALLLTGVIKIPGFLDGSLGSSLATGNPESDAITMIKKQEDFARVANDAAADGMLDEREMKNLEKMYKEILVFFGSYAGNKEAQDIMDKYIEENYPDRAKRAENEFERAMRNLMDCDGFEEFSLRMQNLVDRLNINFDDF